MRDDRERQIQDLQTRALVSVLEHVLMLADPTCDDVRIWPFNTPGEEQQRRAAMRPYLMSYIVQPLADVLTRDNLGAYKDVAYAPRSATEIGDEMVKQLLTHWAAKK